MLEVIRVQNTPRESAVTSGASIELFNAKCAWIETDSSLPFKEKGSGGKKPEHMQQICE